MNDSKLEKLVKFMDISGVEDYQIFSELLHCILISLPAQYLKSKHSSAEHQSRVDDTKLLHVEKTLTNREKVIETMRRDIGRLQERVAGIQ